MSANIKVYDSALCTQELEISGALYELVSGPSTGIDCRSTDVEVSTDVWVKNVGDSVAMYVNVVKDGDPLDRVSFSSGTASSNGTLALGSMAVGSSKQVRITIKLPQGTPSGLYNLSVLFRYKSVP